MDNQTSVTEFILLGLSSDPKLQIVLFVVFLLIYLLTLFVNLAIFTAIRIDSHLRTPMYVLLSYLAVLDVAFSSSTVPKMLENLLRERKAISVQSCFAQVFIVTTVCVGEGVLISVMAYDRYVAICHPLHYMAIMNKQICRTLLCVALLIGFLFSLTNTIPLITLNFCGSNLVHHFCCEPPQLFKLSCSSTFANHVVMLTSGTLLGLGALSLTLASYIRIIFAVLRINSMEGKRKAFSTCTSHLTVVVLAYGAIFFRYLRNSTKDFQDQEMIPSIVYLILTPMLNPIIYSFRSQEVKRAIVNIVVKKKTEQQ